VLLSAQATDKQVNIATKKLFAIANTPQQILDLGDELFNYIQSIGLYRNKGKNLLATCRILIEKWNHQVPNSREDLEELPGVGRKTANVILNVWFKEPTMAVDTHVFRVSHRVGLSKGTTPLAVELDLVKKIPSEYLYHAHNWLILLGRYTCKAQNPLCKTCSVQPYCMTGKKLLKQLNQNNQ
jgi:endonuclease-3